MDNIVDFDSVKNKISKLKSDRDDLAIKSDTLEQQLKDTQEKLDKETSDKEALERKIQQLEADAFAAQSALEESIKQLAEKLETEENKSAECEREVNRLRMENEQVEKSLAETQEKYKDLIDALGGAVADLNNV